MRELVESFFRERSIVNHHIASFNDFLPTIDNPNDATFLDRAMDPLEQLDDRVRPFDLRELVLRECHPGHHRGRLVIGQQPMFGDELVIEGVKGHWLLSLGDLGVLGSGWVGRVRCPDGPAGNFGPRRGATRRFRTPDHPVSSPSLQSERGLKAGCSF